MGYIDRNIVKFFTQVAKKWGAARAIVLYLNPYILNLLILKIWFVILQLSKISTLFLIMYIYPLLLKKKTIHYFLMVFSLWGVIISLNLSIPSLLKCIWFFFILYHSSLVEKVLNKLFLFPNLHF